MIYHLYDVPITAFILCFLPSALLGLFDPMPPCWHNPELHVAAYAVFWLSAVVNPFIYTLSNRHYRAGLVRTLRSMLECNRVPENSSVWFVEEEDEDELPSSPEESALTARTKSNKSNKSNRSQTRVRMRDEGL